MRLQLDESYRAGLKVARFVLECFVFVVLILVVVFGMWVFSPLGAR